MTFSFSKIDGFGAGGRPPAGNFVAIDLGAAGVDAGHVVRAAFDGGIIIRSDPYNSARFGERFVRVTTTVPKAVVDTFCEPPLRAAG